MVHTFLKYNENGIDLLESGAKKPPARVASASVSEVSPPKPAHHKKASTPKQTAKLAPSTQVTTLSSQPNISAIEAAPVAAEPPPAVNEAQVAAVPAENVSALPAHPVSIPASAPAIIVASTSTSAPVAVSVPAAPANPEPATPTAANYAVTVSAARKLIAVPASEEDEPSSAEPSANATVSAVPLPLVTSRDEDLAKLSPAAGSPAPAASAAPAESAASPASSASEKETLDLSIAPQDSFAAFSRQKSLWIVVRNPSHVALEDLQKLSSHYITGVQKISNSHAAVFVLSLNAEMPVAFEKAEGDKVHMILQPASAALKDNLLPALHTNTAKLTYLSVPAGKAEEVITQKDPVNGDELNIIPLPDPGTGLTPARTFTGFNLLPTAQGIVVQKTADDISIAVHQGAVEVTSPKGLTVSAEATKRMEQSALDAANDAAPPTLFPYSRWRLDDEKNFVPEQVRLFHDIAYGNMEAANKARLRLLQIYLSEGLFVEAKGMANDILRVSYKFYRDNKVSALRGASYFFIYRFVEAERDFSAPELAHDPEAQMWLSLCRELLGEKDIAKPFNFLANYDHIIRTYPPPFIQKLAIIAADLNINRKEYDSAISIFELLKKDNLDGPVDKYITYMRGKVLSETKGIEEAEKIWEKQAGNVDDPLIRARAEFSLVNLMLHEDIITPEEATKRLEKLRIVWRGDQAGA